jgi:hypothetical protein
MLFITITNIRLKRYLGFKITVNKCSLYKKAAQYILSGFEKNYFLAYAWLSRRALILSCPSFIACCCDATNWLFWPDKPLSGDKASR